MQNIKLSVLTRNELIKMRSRKLNIVFAAVILAITLLSFCRYALLTSYDYQTSMSERAEHYLQRAKDIRDGGRPYDSYFDNETVPTELAVLEMLEYARIYQYADSLGITGSGDWRYDGFYEYMVSAATANVIVDQIENGKEYAAYISDYINTAGYNTPTYNEFKRRSETCEQYSAKLRDMKYTDHIGTLYTQKTADYIEYQRQIAAHGEQSEAKIIEHEIKCEFYETALYAYKYIIDNDLDSNDPMAKQAVNIVNFTEINYGELVVYEYGTVDGYDPSVLRLDPYDEYLAERRSTFEGFRTQLAAGRYCLDHNVYDVAASGASRKAANAFFGNFSTLYIFALIVFSTVTASEFSPKTVNMLLIRPVSRKKIMQSKFCAASITVTSVYAVCFALHTVLALTVTGGSDFLQPVITNFFGNTVAIAYPLYMLFNFICCCTSAIMLGSLAFMFATLTRNSTAGTLLGIASTVFSTVTSLIVLFFGTTYYYWFPLTYAAIWEHVGTGITCTAYYYDVYETLSTLFGTGTGAAGNLLYGLIINLLLTALWLYCAISSFKRRDIK